MDSQEIKQIIVNLFLGGDESFPIDDDTDLLEAGICDSLGLAQVARELEERVPELRIHDPDITAENLGSIDRIRRFVETLTA